MKRSENADEAREDFYQEIPSKFGLYFILAVCGAFAAMFTLGALARGIREADDWLLLIMGLAATAATVRLYQISFWPTYSLTQDELIIRKWFGKHRILYSEIESLSEYSQWTKPRNAQTGKKLEPFLIHYLTVTFRSGKLKTFALPTYHSNQALLESIGRRANRKIESLGVRGERGYSGTFAHVTDGSRVLIQTIKVGQETSEGRDVISHLEHFKIGLGTRFAGIGTSNAACRMERKALVEISEDSVVVFQIDKSHGVVRLALRIAARLKIGDGKRISVAIDSQRPSIRWSQI